jgi:fucose permease
MIHGAVSYYSWVQADLGRKDDMKLRTLPVFLAFLAMGFGDAVGPFVSLAKSEFQLSNAVASLIPFVGFSMFGLLSIPVGLFQDKRGKKFVLLMGLAVALVGLLNATFAVSSFPGFLVTILLLGAGAAILQVAGNPFMRDVSEEGKYSRNLSLAQFVKAIGSLSGPLIPVAAARWFGASWKVIFPIYAVAILVTLLAVSGLKVDEKRSKDRPATLASCLKLLGNGYVFAMVAAIFLYVGAEVSVSSGIPLFLKESYRIDVNSVAHDRPILRRRHFELDVGAQILHRDLVGLHTRAGRPVRTEPYRRGGQFLRRGAGICQYLPAGFLAHRGIPAAIHQ